LSGQKPRFLLRSSPVQTVTLMHFVKSLPENKALEKELFGQQKQEKGEPVPLK